MWRQLSEQIAAVAPPRARADHNTPGVGRRGFTLGLMGAAALPATTASEAGASQPPPAAASSGPSDGLSEPPTLTVAPALPWTWPVIPAMVSPEQHRICDTIPDLAGASGVYVPTSSSFSDNYGAFLAVLDPEAPPSGVLAAALAAYRNDGFKTYVDYETTPVARRPAWYVQSPADWLAGIDRSAAPPRAIHLNCPVPSSPAPSLLATCANGAWTDVDLGGAVQSLLMSAQAWGRAPISPGGWFDSGALAVKRPGPYLPGFAAEATPGKTAVFGPQGLLNGRVSELIVALRPQVVLTLSGAISTDAQSRLKAAEAVRLGPSRFDVGRGEVTTRLSSAGAVISGAVGDDTPWIVAMTIELF